MSMNKTKNNIIIKKITGRLQKAVNSFKSNSFERFSSTLNLGETRSSLRYIFFFVSTKVPGFLFRSGL